MTSSLPVNYVKPWTSIADQVKQLEARGLLIKDRSEAEGFISHVSYYRFSGYCLAFEDTRHQFRANTSFENIRDAYLFDSKLRDLFREATELIEVDLRSIVSHIYGQIHGAFGHIDPQNFHRNFPHSKWIQKLQTETKRSSEIFVNHFRVRYRQFPDLPIWAATEVMSFGALSRMVFGLWKADRKHIAPKYRLNARELSSVVHHFVYVRNLCAHHCRLWDREWTIKPDLPRSSPFWKPPHVSSNERIWCTMLLVRWMLSRDPKVTQRSDDWRDRVSRLLRTPPKSDNPLTKMGLPHDWESNQIWTSS